MRSIAAANSSASFTRITPRLPESPTGFRTDGNGTVAPYLESGDGVRPPSEPRNGENGRTEVGGQRLDEADSTANSGDGKPAAARAVRDRRLSLLARAPITECHGRPRASAARAARR